MPRERMASRRRRWGKCSSSRRYSSELLPSAASRFRPWIQQLPMPRLLAMRCMLAMTMEQSSVHTSVTVSSPRTTMAAAAPVSMLAAPVRAAAIFSSVSLFFTTISSQGRRLQLDGERRPACTIFVIASSGIGAPVYCLILRRFCMISSNSINNPFLSFAHIITPNNQKRKWILKNI